MSFALQETIILKNYQPTSIIVRAHRNGERLTKSPSKTGVPPIIDNEQVFENDMVEANLFNSFFCKQSNVDDSLAVLPPLEQFLTY